jgi:hypothetical protein
LSTLRAEQAAFVAAVMVLSAPTSKPIAYITAKDIIYPDDRFCVPQDKTRTHQISLPHIHS